jgi:hypothetical protein
MYFYDNQVPCWKVCDCNSPAYNTRRLCLSGMKAQFFVILRFIVHRRRRIEPISTGQGTKISNKSYLNLGVFCQ